MNKNLDIENLENLSPSEKRLLLTRLLEKEEETRNTFPLSFAQERIWFLSRLEGGSVTYNEPVALNLKGTLNIGVLEKSLNEIVRRHEILRTHFPCRKDRPTQVVSRKLHTPLPVINLQHLSGDEQLMQVKTLTVDEAHRPFNLEKGPLLRFLLLRLAQKEHILLATMHHIITDAWSQNIFLREMRVLYNAFSRGLPSPLPALPIQYADFSAWQRKRLKGEIFDTQLNYWKNQLSGAPPVLDLPTDLPRPSIRTFQGSSLHFHFCNTLTEKLKNLNTQSGTTLFMSLLAAFALLLSRFCRQEDIIIGTPIANRHHKQIEPLLGMFVNTLVMRIDLSRNPTCKELLSRIRKMTMEAYAHQEFPFEKLVEQLQPERSLGHSPLFQIMFMLQNTPYKIQDHTNPIGSRDLSIRLIKNQMDTAKFDLVLKAIETGNRINFEFEYSTQLYKKKTIQRFFKYYQAIITFITTDPEKKISDVEIITWEEKKQILEELNGTKVEYPNRETLHRLFKAQVERTPNNTAVIGQSAGREAQSEREKRCATGAGRCALTYRELNEKSNQLAYLLNNRGVRADTIVGIMVERSIEMIIGILGILKSGGAYLPIDPDYPEERINYMLKDSEVKILVTASGLSGKFEKLSIVNCKILMVNEKPSNRRRLNIPPQEANSINNYQLTINNLQLKQVSLAYIIYTSGTTGKPKGTLVEHRNVVQLMFHHNHSFDFKNTDTWTMFHSYGFDFSVWEMYGALLYGGKLILVTTMTAKDPGKFLQVLKKECVTVLNQTPTAFYNLVNEELTPLHTNGTKKLHLRYVIFGGEALMPVKLKEWQSTYPKTRLVNMFGITETTVHVTYKKIGHDEIDENISNIGKPLPTLSAFVMDTGLNLLPPGIPGELCVGGPGVARGYLNQVTLTAEKFIENPYQKGETLYKSGDLVKLLENCEMQYLGRIDLQVKIRGHRIELGEIESHLLQRKEIKEARVITWENETGDKYLCAYMVPSDPSTVSSTTAQWREYLAKSLPSYMIPSYFVKVETIPLTPNGKLDRKSLPDPVKAGFESGITYAAPRNETQRKLVETWACVLGREHIGIHDNFFMIGGDSIKSIQIASRMNEAGYKIQIEDIFQYQTPAQLAPHLKKVEQVPQQTPVMGKVPLTPIQKTFFQTQKIDHHHFNQAVMLYSETRFAQEAIKTVFKKLLQHHDALRMTFKQENGEILQENHGFDYPLSLEEYNLTNLAKSRDILWDKANQIQASIDLQTGPLMKLGLVHLKDGDHLLIAVHHLVIDGVSWRILLEDLDTLLRQYQKKEKLHLPLKSDSFKSWAEKLSTYAHSEELLKEKIYWEQLELQSVPKINADFPGETNFVQDTVSLSFTLNEEETDRLLTKVNEPFGTEINDILLTALGLAVNKMFGHNKLLIALEGHGREPISENVNINRTIGWFTSVYPVILNISYPHDLSQQIKTIKETLHQIPHKGIGYGLLNHLTPDKLVGNLEFKLKPQVSFNYLGQFDTDLRQKSFVISRGSTGHTRSLRGQREYTLDITGMISANHLEMVIVYSKKQFKTTTIETLMYHYKNELQGVIAHCCQQKDKDFTPSDMTYKEISLENLEQLKKQYPTLEDVYPLSPMQEGMFFHALFDRSSSAYFEQLSYRLMGDLNIPYVEKALHALSKRHEILRTAFVSLKSERLLQVVLKEREIEFYYQDISDQPDKESFLAEFKKIDRQRYFDLGKDALMRVAVFRLKNGEYEFIWSHHHILMDGWCVSILISEFSEFYHGYLEKRDPKLPPVKQYRTYIKWLHSQDKHLSKNYWKKYLDYYEEATGVSKMIGHKSGDMPYIRERVLLALDKEKTRSLNRLAAENHVTLNTVIQTVWAILLGKYNRKGDVVFGAVVSGRPPEIPGMEFMVGLFINTIPVRINYTEDTPFNNLLQAVQKGNLNSEPHHYYPLAEIQSQCSLKHNLLDHILIFENYPIAKAIHDIITGENIKSTLKLSNLDAFEQTNYDLNLVIQPAERLSIKFDYNANVYNHDFVEEVSNHFNTVLQQILTAWRCLLTVKEITLISPAEQEQLLYEFNHTTAGYPEEKTIQQLFQEQVEHTPGNIALEGQCLNAFGQVQLSYRELNERADQTAHLLLKNGVTSGSIVAIMEERSIEMIIGMLGILKAGGAYLPIEPDYPQERIDYMLVDSGAKVLLTDNPSGHFNCQLSIVNSQLSMNEEPPPAVMFSKPQPAAGSLQPVYIIYTSGTIGKPKGALIHHRNVVRLMVNDNSPFDFSSHDVWTMFHSYCFDFSVWEMYGALLYGGKLILISTIEARDPGVFLKKLKIGGVTILNQTPTAFYNLCNEELKYKDKALNLNYIIFGGEALKPLKLKEWKAKYPGTKMINMFGITETTVHVTYKEIGDKEIDLNISNIGNPIPTLHTYVMDQDAKLLPLGVAGELCVGGDGVGIGYLNQPELTAKKFIENPYRPGEKIYRSGDLVRLMKNGEMEYLGRIDLQVKLRGFRIELGEIENRLLKRQEIKEAVVMLREEKNGEKQLCAYIVSEEDVKGRDLKQYLSGYLPNYMIPSYFVPLEKIPLTPNGKIDRKALPGPEGLHPQLNSTYIAPKTDIEKSIANVWRETLHLDKVGVDDNFFDLGGNSIKIIQVSNQLQEALKRDIPVVILFKYPTIASLAEYLSQEGFLPQKQERTERTRKKEMGKERLNKKRKLKLKN